MDSKTMNHTACIDRFQIRYQETPPDAMVDTLLRFLDETCDFNSVNVVTKVAVDLTPENDLTPAALLRFLLNEPNAVIADLSQFAFNKIQFLVDCRPRATNGTNLIAIEDKHGNIAALYLVANNGTSHNFLVQLLYIPESDQLYIDIPLSWRGAYHELFPALKKALAQLPGDQNGRFLLDRSFRAKAVDNLILCDGFVPYFWNGYDHLGHYFLNYLGPLARLLEEGVFPTDRLLLLGCRPSWLGEVELSHIIPSLNGFDKVQSHAIFVASMQDASKICRVTNLGMLSLHGSDIPLALSRSFARYIDLNASHVKIDSPSFSDDTLIIGIGLRGGTRMVVNLDEVIFNVFGLLKSIWDNKIHVIFDGICKSPNPENPSTLLLSLDQEIQQAQQLSSSLEDLGISAECVVGMNIVDQLQRLSMCSLIVTHSGSGSAKYLWALNKPTIVLNSSTPIQAGKYNSSSDPCRHGAQGLIAGRAFRGDRHSDEYYIDESLVHLVDAGPTSDTSGTRGNAMIDVERGSAQIIKYISQILGTALECQGQT